MASDFRLKEDLPNLTDRIVESYAEVGTINHLGHCPLPRYSVIISAVHDLMDVFYPGYRRREGLHIGNVAYYVGDLIDGLHDKLTTQIARAIEHEDRVNKGSACTETRMDFEARGQLLAIELLGKIPAIRKTLATDVHAAYDGDPACKSHDEVIFCYPGLEAISAYRIAHELYKLNVPFIPRMITEFAHKETGIDIHPGATIGDHFFIDHGTGVVIGETCHIGNHVKIYQGVTLGALSFPKDADGNLDRTAKRHPTIEDGVVIYANATVLGGKTIIGREAVVGSSVWVTKSIESHATVLAEQPELKIRGKTASVPMEMNYQI